MYARQEQSLLETRTILKHGSNLTKPNITLRRFVLIKLKDNRTLTTLIGFVLVTNVLRKNSSSTRFLVLKQTLWNYLIVVNHSDLEKTSWIMFWNFFYALLFQRSYRDNNWAKTTYLRNVPSVVSQEQNEDIFKSFPKTRWKNLSSSFS